MIPQPVQNSESVLMGMFLPVVSTENDDNEITIIEENIPTTPTIKRIRKSKRKSSFEYYWNLNNWYTQITHIYYLLTTCELKAQFVNFIVLNLMYLNEMNF